MNEDAYFPRKQQKGYKAANKEMDDPQMGMGSLIVDGFTDG